MVFDIWREGYRVTGGYELAEHLAQNIEANSFIEAVQKWYNTIPNKEHDDLIIINGSAYFWGCKLFDNEYDARRLEVFWEAKQKNKIW